MKNYKLNWWNLIILLISICIIIILTFIYKTSDDLWSLSSNRDDWKDIAEFVSFLASPVLAICAVYFAWKTIKTQKEARSVDLLIIEITRLLPEIDTIKLNWKNRKNNLYTIDEMSVEFSAVISRYLHIRSAITRMRVEQEILNGVFTVFPNFDIKIMDFVTLNNFIVKNFKGHLTANPDIGLPEILFNSINEYLRIVYGFLAKED